MIETRVFDADPEAGIVRYFHYDHDTDSFTIETVQDVKDIVEDNKRAFNTFDERSSWKGDLHLVARLPLNVFYDLRAKNLIDVNMNVLDQAELDRYMARWLNSNENAAWRTRPGRI